MLNRNRIVWIATVLFSFLFIFAGNRLVSRDLQVFQEVGAAATVKAEVVSIKDRITNRYEAGGDSSFESLTLLFNCRILSGQHQGEVVMAYQSFYEMMEGITDVKEVEPGDRRYYAPTGLLYKVRDGQGHITQESWTPDKTPAMWAVVDVTHAGTAEDPIPAVRGMEYTYGLCYLDGEDGRVYRCERTDEAEGGKITLQYLPHELVGQYFTEVTD